MESKSTVFVVDDDQAMRNSLKWLIETIGMSVDTYDSADAFLEKYGWNGKSRCEVSSK